MTDYQEYQQSLFKTEESVEAVTKDTEISSVGKATFIDTPGLLKPDWSTNHQKRLNDITKSIR